MCKCANEAGLSSKSLQSNLLLIEFECCFCRKAYISGPSRHLPFEEWGKEDPAYANIAQHRVCWSLWPSQGTQNKHVVWETLADCQASVLSIFSIMFVICGFSLTPLWLLLSITVCKSGHLQQITTIRARCLAAEIIKTFLSDYRMMREGKKKPFYFPSLFFSHQLNANVSRDLECDGPVYFFYVQQNLICMQKQLSDIDSSFLKCVKDWRAELLPLCSLQFRRLPALLPVWDSL